jgi:hypothetical protein
MSKLYRIPKRYYIDHVECDCEAPPVVKETKQHYWISAEEGPDLAELRSRAQYYVDMQGAGGFGGDLNGLCASARATLKVIGDSAEQSKAFEENYLNAHALATGWKQ